MQRTDLLKKNLGKDPRRDWRQDENRLTKDEMFGWHYRLDEHQGLGVDDGQGGLACCNSWGHKESDLTEPLNWSELNWTSTIIAALFTATRTYKGFPGGSDSKESACNAGDPDLIPGSDRSPGEGDDNTLQYFCLKNSKQPRCPLTVEWKKKMWYIYTMEYYSVIKRKALGSVLIRWMTFVVQLLSHVQLYLTIWILPSFTVLHHLLELKLMSIESMIASTTLSPVITFSSCLHIF